MKKIIGLSALLVFAFSMAACSSSSSGTSSTTNAPKAEKKVVASAEDAVNLLKSAGLSVGKEEVYTAENDPNKLLGRPGQYTGKVNFVDTSIKADGTQTGSIEVGNGGSVEMFASADDAQKRFDYVSNIAKSSPMFNEYDYVSGKLVVRVSKELTPDQAKKYEDALKTIPQ